MKIRSYKKLLFFFLFIFILPIGLFLWKGVLDNIATKNNAKAQIGKYVLDIQKSKLGVYQMDSTLFFNLSITFFDDFTFNFNKKVAFIFDSTGNWSPQKHGIDEWTILNYTSRNSKGNILDNQISTCCTSDGYIYISPTPQEYKAPVMQLAFKKVNGIGIK